MCRLSSPSPIQSTWLTQGPGLTWPAEAKAEERHGAVEEQRESCVVSHMTPPYTPGAEGGGVWTDATHARAETTYTLRHFEGNKTDTAVRNTFSRTDLKLTCVLQGCACTNTVPMSALNKCSLSQGSISSTYHPVSNYCDLGLSIQTHRDTCACSTFLADPLRLACFKAHLSGVIKAQALFESDMWS